MNEPIHPEGAILNAVLELPADARAAYLDKACAGDIALRQRVEALLQAHAQAQGFLETQPNGLGLNREGTALLPPVEKAGDCIGPYKLLQQIGEGGCGVVYMAEQKTPIHRRVALKVIKPGMDTKQVIARFDAERQALALMDHPNIAKVLDAGATESGRPYFVMELVRGTKITDFCDEQNLPTDERLRLFMQVCQAVQHAHQKGVIHRDIKPSNILVTINDGVPVPKVIDFGISKATQGRLTDQTVFTAFEQFIGTPAYMSPEQAVLTSLDVDTRSDIYSLGVLLYELLTGSTPFDQKDLLSAGMDEMRRTIREQEPPLPSTRLSAMPAAALTTTAKRRRTDAPMLIHLVRGDLDWIVMKCLEKDRTRRYETANGLAADLKRFLEDEPVVATPPSPFYRLGKAVKRHRLAFSAGVLVAVALVSGAAVSLWQAARARQAEKIANQRRLESEKARAEAESVSSFLIDVFKSPDPARDGRTITVVETLDRAAKWLETTLTNQPPRRARLQGTLGSTYQALGLTGEAVPLLEKARDYHLNSSGPEDQELRRAMDSLVWCYYSQGRTLDLVALCEADLAHSQKVNGPEHQENIQRMFGLIVAYTHSGRKEDAFKLGEPVIALSRKINGPGAPMTLWVMKELANCYSYVGYTNEARKLREDARGLGGRILAQKRKTNSTRTPETLEIMRMLASCYEEAGQSTEAIQLRQEILTVLREAKGPEHAETVEAMQNLAGSFKEAGMFRDALRMHEEIVKLQTKTLGPENSATISAMRDLANSYGGITARRKDALKLREEMVRLKTKRSGPENPDTIPAISDLALSYADLGRRDEALKLREQALALVRKLGIEEHLVAYRVMANLAASYVNAGRPEEAIQLFQEALRLRRKANGEDAQYNLGTMNCLGVALILEGQPAEASKLLDEVTRREDTDVVFEGCGSALLQVWFGFDADYLRARERLLRRAADTHKLSDASFAAMVASFRPIPELSQQETALLVARKAVELAGKDPWIFLHQLVLGMAEYRSGHYELAEQAFLAAERGARENPDGPCTEGVLGAAGFYRVMILAHQAKAVEAAKLFSETASAMKQLPKDGTNPLADGASYQDLVMWLAYREAKPLLRQGPETSSKSTPAPF